MEKLKILIVDDDNNLREMYAEIFQRADFEVFQADNGMGGLDIATMKSPDVIFTGIMMPKMDGFTMMESLRQNEKTANIPIVVSSHMGNEEDRERAKSLGAKDFIVRGMTRPIEVIERIKSIFADAGSEYKIGLEPYVFDAQKLANDLNFETNFQCSDCKERMVLKLKLTDFKNHVFEARFICPRCGWVAK